MWKHNAMTAIRKGSSRPAWPMRIGLACGLAWLGATTALATDFPEIEPNDAKATATVASPMVAGDTISGTSISAATTGLDYFRVRTGSLPLGVYQHRLTITTGGTAGHVGTIRGLNQTGGVIGATDSIAQTSLAAVMGTLPARSVQWYGFGHQEEVYFRATGTASTTAPYTATLATASVAVTPISTVFAPGTMTITTVGQTTTDTELWVYDSQLNALLCYADDDDPGGATLQSRITRNFDPGSYILAVTTFNFANNLPSPTISPGGCPFTDDFITGVVLDFPNAATNNIGTLNQIVNFQITDSTPQTVNVPAIKPSAFDIVWFSFQVGQPGALSATGNANPSSVQAGASTLLTVNVMPATNPPSTFINVTGNLTSIGGSAAQAFTDNGGNVFTFNAAVALNTAPGPKLLPITATDQSGSFNFNISLTVTPAINIAGAANPSTVSAGGTTLLTGTVTPGVNPPSSGIVVTGNLTLIGGSATQAFFDNGTNGDVTPNDLVYSFQATVAPATVAGVKMLPLNVVDAQGRTASTNITLTVTPSNDLCASAEVVTFGTITRSNVGAATDGSASCGATRTSDVWFRYTSTCDYTAILDTCGSHDLPGLNLGMDTVLSVHSACPGTTGNQLACNDDYTTPAPFGGCVDSGTIRDSAVSVTLTAGQTIIIRVASFATGVQGTFRLRIQDPPACVPQTIASANPPTAAQNGGTPFRDTLQNTDTSLNPQGIGQAGTPDEVTVTNYAQPQVTFSGTLLPPPTPANITVSCTGGTCPTVTAVTGAGPSYTLTLSGQIPPLHCITLTFAGTVAGEKLQYSFGPGDTNLNGTITGQDVLSLVTAINTNTATLPRHDINRNQALSGQDVLREVQLLNGGITVSPSTGYNAATVTACP